MSAEASAEVSAAVPRSRDTLRQTWCQRLQRFADAQLSVVAFCRQEGVSAHAFYYWKHKLAPDTTQPTASGPRLLPVQLLPAGAPVELVLNNGNVLRLAPGCDLAFVRSLVNALGDTTC